MNFLDLKKGNYLKVDHTISNSLSPPRTREIENTLQNLSINSPENVLTDEMYTGKLKMYSFNVEFRYRCNRIEYSYNLDNLACMVMFFLGNLLLYQSCRLRYVLINFIESTV